MNIDMFFSKLSTLFFLCLYSTISIGQTAEWIFNPNIQRSNPSVWNNSAGFSKSLTDQTNGDIFLLTSLRDTVTYGADEFISKASSTDILLMRLDVTGKIIWTKQIGGVKNDYSYSVSFQNDQLLLALSFVDSTQIEGQKYYNTNGNILLVDLLKSNGSVTSVDQKNINGTVRSFTTTDDDIYIAGLFTINSSLGSFDLPDPYITDPWGNQRPTSYIYLAKLAPDKSPQWIKHSVHSSCCVTPKIIKAKVNPINGDIIILASPTGAIAFDGNYVSSNKGFYYSIIICFGSNGQVKWVQKGEAADDYAFSDVIFNDLDFDNSGNIYLIGNYSGEAKLGNFRLRDENGSGNNNGFVTKINYNNGDFIWAKAILGDTQTNISSIIGKDGDFYFGGSFRGFLKFDSLEIIPPTSSLTRGYIGKIENGDSFNKLLLTETSLHSTMNVLNDHIDNHIMTIGTFYNDLSIGCVSTTGGVGIPYLSRVDLDEEIDVPNISGPKEACINDSFFVTINNFDPNNTYSIKTPNGVNIVGQVGHEIELSIDSGAPDTINLSCVAINVCDWRAFSNNLTLFKKDPPVLEGEIQSPITFCEGKEIIISVKPNDEINTYHWSVPQELSKDEKTNITSENDTLIIYANSSLEIGEIEVFGSNICGNSNMLSKEVTIISSIPNLSIEGDQLVCNDNSNNVYEVYLPKNLIGSLNYNWEVSSDLLLPNNQTQQTTNQNNIKVGVNQKFTKPDQWIKVSAQNECYTSEFAKLNLEGSELADTPLLDVTKCDKSIEVNLTKNFKWYLNGIPIENKSPVINSPDSGYYQVESTTSCDTKWSKAVAMNPINVKTLNIPNIITPNGDSHNETFVIDPSLKGSKISIYNRWGEKIYQNYNYKNEWDAENLNNGVYFYSIKNECLLNQIKGSITVMK